MPKRIDVVSEYDYSKIESILLDGIVLTNPLIDYIHGVLPDKTPPENKNRLLDLFLGILERGEEIVSHRDLSQEKPIQESELWHHLCQMRRIVWRITGAINGQFHRKALADGKHQVSVNSLVRLRQLRSNIVNIIIKRTNQILEDITKGKKTHWNSIATAYEAGIILRAKGDVGAAIDLASKIRNSDVKIIQPAKSNSISGLVSFNYVFWKPTNHYDPDYPNDLFNTESSPQGNLLALSEIVSRNSLYAASRRLNSNNFGDQHNLFVIVGHIDRVCSNKEMNVDPTSISHIEGLFRVLLYQGITNSAFLKGNDHYTHYYVSTCLTETVPSLLERCEFKEKWIKDMIDSDMKQKRGIFLASNTKSFLLDEGSDIPEKLTGMFTEEIKENVSELVNGTWTNWRDSDAMVRMKYRRSAMEDLTSRLEGGSNYELSELSDLLGKPCEPNPLTTDGLAKWFSTENGRSDTESSRHLRLFPQGKINESQVAVTMALMQQIMRLETGVGVWKNLDEILKLDNQAGRKNPWKISKVGSGPRLQFTVGYFSGSYAIGNLDDGNIDTKKLKRQYLTRVNKADEIMLISNAISMMSKVIHSQLQKSMQNPESYFLENLFLCRNDDLFSERKRSIISNPSLQELFYLSREISNSPIRVFEPTHYSRRIRGKKNKVKEDDLTLVFDNILRISFARIYSLSIATEHLARILVKKPLREPFLSCCVLLVDQIRILLQNLRESLASAYPDYKPKEADKFERVIFENLNKMKNKFKPNYFKNLKQIDLIDDQDDDVTEVRSDLAIEYYLAYNTTTDEQVGCLNRLYYRLDFKQNIGEEWNTVFKNAVKLRYDYPGVFEESQIFAIAPDWNSEFVKITNNEEGLIMKFDDLIDVISENPDNEKLRVLWSRLLWYPTAFVGRVLVNANSPREINEGEDPVPLLFGKPRQSFVPSQ